MKKKALTKNTLKKYKLVIDEWFNNKFNGKQAYLKYYKNVTGDTATTNFSKIQNYPEVAEYIKEKHKKASSIIEATHEGVLKQLIRWLELDITETIELTPDQIKELPIWIRVLITKYKTTTREIHNSKGEVIETIKTIELHFVSKEKAMEMINKHIGFYEVDNRQKAAKINIVASNEKHKKLIEGILKGQS